MKKQQLGQFFTENSDYILAGLTRFIKGKEVQDPFAGNKDLMNWARKNGAKTVKGFDVDAGLVDNKEVFLNDSLKNPMEYKFVITNPPYLHKNKADLETKKNYFSGNNSIFEDLYQVSLKSIMNSEEGIIIVPLNFLSAENSSKIRKLFFDKFEILHVNIFFERVFEDTTYNVIAFYYRKKSKTSDSIIFTKTIYPNKINGVLRIRKQFGWKIGGEFIEKIKHTRNVLGIKRFTEDMIKPGKKAIKVGYTNLKTIRHYNVEESLAEVLQNNILLLNSIDSKSKKKICLENVRDYDLEAVVGKNTSRNLAYLIFEKNIDIKVQIKLIEYFNNELNEARKEYLSFFLTNFRDNNRKRISFDFSYKLLNYLYQKHIIHDAYQSKLF